MFGRRCGKQRKNKEQTPPSEQSSIIKNQREALPKKNLLPFLQILIKGNTMSAGNNSRIHHFKLVLLGDTAVGKSCLVVRFVRDEFFEFQEPTIGGKVLFSRRKRRMLST